MRKCLVALTALVATVMILPAVSAGPNGVWGKGILSETMPIYVGDSDVPSGYLYWNPETADFIYGLHGGYLESDTRYCLIAYDGSPAEEPDDWLMLGSSTTCDYLGVHIKGVTGWPGFVGATVCLVPETYAGLGGSDGWTPDAYQVAYPVGLA